MGFARWVTLLIQAHLEEEFERLRQAVLKIPISNPDDSKSAFPRKFHDGCSLTTKIAMPAAASKTR